MRIATALAMLVTTDARGRLCLACVDALEVSGAGITLMTGTGAGPVCSSDPRTASMEDLQFTLGEGPCNDAFGTRAPVAAPDLGFDAAGRWPAFVDSAVSVGIGAVFAYPLQARHTRVGVLTIYQDRPGSLTDGQSEIAEELAEVLATTVLTMVRTRTIAPALDDAVAHRAEVHQATGMVAAQLDVSPPEALARIRAHAYAQDRSFGEVAADVVGRRLRLTDDGSTGRKETPPGD
jgi:hypothetical protein